MRMGQEPSGRWVPRSQPYATSAWVWRPAAVSAIADSTWSHTSVCPPANHGMAPQGSWTAAIADAVLATWSLVSTPASDGTSGNRTGDRRLAQVDHEALADEGIEQPVGEAGQPWLC